MTEIKGAKCDVCGRTVLEGAETQGFVSFSGPAGTLVFQLKDKPSLSYSLTDKDWCPRCLVADITRWVDSFAPPPRRCDYGGCGQPAASKSTLLRTTDVPIYSCSIHRYAWEGRSWEELP